MKKLLFTVLALSLLLPPLAARSEPEAGRCWSGIDEARAGLSQVRDINARKKIVDIIFEAELEKRQRDYADCVALVNKAKALENEKEVRR